jgi:hypothetical protein
MKLKNCKSIQNNLFKKLFKNINSQISLEKNIFITKGNHKDTLT